MLTEDPLHPDFLALEPGDWIEFLAPTFLRRGLVLKREGMSLLVQYQGFDEPTAIPYAEDFFANPTPGVWVMQKIDPQRMIAAPTGKTMTVRQAAARMGTDTKTIRRKLRSGELRGEQKEGKWVGVYPDTSRSAE